MESVRNCSRMIGHPVFSPNGELFQVVGTVVDVTERKRAEEWHLQGAFDEIKRLKDALYRENLALRDEIDRATPMLPLGNCWHVRLATSSPFADCPCRSDRVYGFYHRRDWHREGTHRPRYTQAIATVRTGVCQCQLCGTCACADSVGAVWARERGLHGSNTETAWAFRAGRRRNHFS